MLTCSIIVAIGDNSDSPLKIGSRVGIKWLADSCLDCELCRTGLEAHCAQAKFSGYLVDGSFQEYAVSYLKHLTVIPDGLDMAAAARKSFSQFKQLLSIQLSCALVSPCGKLSRVLEPNLETGSSSLVLVEVSVIWLSNTLVACHCVSSQSIPARTRRNSAGTSALKSSLTSRLARTSLRMSRTLQVAPALM